MFLETYGRSTGFCIDPIEKKPLNQFLPGTPVLSFGTAGCNLGCKFCQNWDISKSREVARLSEAAGPEAIAEGAVRSGCRSVAFTYNDPVIWAEYAIDVARACRAQGLKTVAVTAGYISAEARAEFFAEMDAANVDLKAFSEEFYFKITASHLQPVLETLEYLKHQTNVWIELTNLVIPEANDRPDEFRQMSDWILNRLGDDVPLHFSAFHPDYKMLDRPHTPVETLQEAHQIATRAGLKYVYIGNVNDPQRQSTYCPGCGKLVIERDWYQIGRYHLEGSQCKFCGSQIAGRFENQPGNWGRRRLPIRIRDSPPSVPRGHAMPEPALTNAVTKQNSPLSLDQAALTQLRSYAVHEVARAVLGNHQVPEYPLPAFLAELPTSGVFVTLKRKGVLRGCCGSLDGSLTMQARIRESARRTALEDHRFTPVTAEELHGLSLSISVLGPAQVVPGPAEDRAEYVEVGKHGLRLRSGNRGGLLLPTVPVEQGWSKQEFLEGICRKAGLPPDAWKSGGSILERFEGVMLDGDLQVVEKWLANVVPVTPFFNDEEVSRINGLAKRNLEALLRGAVPSYYDFSVPDGSVRGLALHLVTKSGKSATSFKLGLRGGFPLQTTLFELCQQGASWINEIARLNSPTEARSVGAQVVLLDHPRPLGTLESFDLQGVNPLYHALVVADSQRTAVAFNFAASDGQVLLTECRGTENFDEPGTQIISWRVASGLQQCRWTNVPQARPSQTARPPAVAGSFYPADDAARNQLVDGFIAKVSGSARTRAVAAMVPHAGLKYSGSLATAVWSRMELPRTVVIIGPKHTSQGVSWGVAPHPVWQLSAATQVMGDVPLARQIAARVAGMELDAEAHAREHGIEVQLPILTRVAPTIRVVGIAMGAASWRQLERAAEQLAGLLKEIGDQPLLVVSSDMNHFADEKETRKRDRLALDRIEKGDPLGLLQDCATHDISMCGKIPAALVMLTLQALGVEASYHSVGYTTSAEVTRDYSRVVGYAGGIWS
jgi:AmmeMemoRadiSam system radical SAM enzyme/AmmeMemoRadiSam system protein B/AmmeMemoRadiSam system protein A